MDFRSFCVEHGWYLGTLLFGFVSGLVPVLNCELYLLWLGTTAPRGDLPLLMLAVNAGQTAAKSLLYWGGRGLVRLPPSIASSRAFAPCRMLASGCKGAALVFASAVTGVPPFYPLSVACGALRFGFVSFLVFGTLGRAVRYTAVLLLPMGFGTKWLPNPLVAGVLVTAAVVLPTAIAYLPQRWRTAVAQVFRNPTVVAGETAETEDVTAA